MLSPRSGYTRAATHWRPLTNASTTLRSTNTRSSNGSSGASHTRAVSGARLRASGAVEEYEVSSVTKLSMCRRPWMWSRLEAMRVYSSRPGERSTFTSSMNSRPGATVAATSSGSP